MFIFLDTETTANGPDDKLCQIAFEPEGGPAVCELFNPGKPISIDANNAQFDMKILQMEGIYTQRLIYTIKLAWFQDKNGVIPKYSLQYLRYCLELEIEAKDHDALVDLLGIMGNF